MEKNSHLSVTDIKRRIKTSFISLTSQQLILRAVAFVSINVILAKLLPVSTLGVFNIASSIITFFAFFSETGLSASLIQKKQEISREDIKTSFTIQLSLVGLISLIILLSAPLLGEFYKLDNQGIWLIRALGVSFFLSSLKVLPAVLLERQLKFNKLVLVEVIETLIFNILLIYFVRIGFDIWSFSIATLCKSISGVVVIYTLSPIKLGIGLNKTVARQLLSFGVPFQMNVLLALLKDRLVPLVVAAMIGTKGVGYITWAQSLAFLPLEVMNIIIRITFPAFSRLQDDKETLGKAVEKSLFMTSLLSYPMLFGLGAILPSVVSFVVSSKWQPAVFSFYLFAVNSFWAVISTTFTNTLNAMGNIKTTLKLMVFWTVLTWILTPALVYFYGFIGVGISSFLISFTSVLTIIFVKKVLVVRVLDAILVPTISSLVMAGGVFLFAQNLVRDRVSLGMAIFFGMISYGLIVFLLGREKILENIKSLRHE